VILRELRGEIVIFMNHCVVGACDEHVLAKRSVHAAAYLGPPRFD
jgi:hypothetical protein